MDAMLDAHATASANASRRRWPRRTLILVGASTVLALVAGAYAWQLRAGPLAGGGQAPGWLSRWTGLALAAAQPSGAQAPPADDATRQLAAKIEELDARVVELESEAERNRAARVSQTQLIDHLRQTIEQKNQAFERLIGKLEESERARAPAAPLTLATPQPAPIDPLVESLNALLLEHGVVEYRLLEHAGVSAAAITDSRWASCNGHGIATGVLTAKAAVLIRDGAQGGLVIELRDGWIMSGGERSPFTDGVFRIAVPHAADEAAKSALLGALLPVVAIHPAAARALPLDRLEPVLGELLEKQGYYLRRVEAVDGSDLKRIVVDEGVPGAAPKRTITAETCRIQAVDPGGYIELLFENGSITTRGREMKFYGNRYRLPLPRTSPSEWQEALGAVVVPRLATRG